MLACKERIFYYFLINIYGDHHIPEFDSIEPYCRNGCVFKVNLSELSFSISIYIISLC